MLEQFTGMYPIFIELRFKAPPRCGLLGRTPPHVRIDSHSASYLACMQQKVLSHSKDFSQATEDLRLGFPKAMLVSM